MESEIDEMHLDRVLKPENFLKVTPKALREIELRSRMLHCCCIVRDCNGVISYSEKYSKDVQQKPRARLTVRYHEILELPEDAVSYLGDAYFEDGSHTLPVHSTVMIDLARVPD